MQKKGIFIAWRVLSKRTVDIANNLDLEIVFYKDKPPYLKAIIKTIIALIRKKPRVVFVQLPQGPLLFIVAILKKIIGFLLVADVHTAFIYYTTTKERLLNAPFKKFLRLCDLVILHNDEIKKLVKSLDIDKKILVLKDPLPEIPTMKETTKENVIQFILPASFNPDEPIETLLEAFTDLVKKGEEVLLYITGRWQKKPELKKYASKNIIFTGFLPTKKYRELLASSDVVIGLTTREYTFLSAAAEALSAEKPMILSDTKTLRSIFYKGTIFVKPTKESLLEGLKRMLDPKVRGKLEEEIRELKKEYLAELTKKIYLLRKIIEKCYVKL